MTVLQKVYLDSIAQWMMRQGANSAVRFTTYTTLKQLVQSRQSPSSSGAAPLSAGTTFGLGAAAGLVTVYTTMPLDVIKTRMQSLGARGTYEVVAYRPGEQDSI